MPILLSLVKKQVTKKFFFQQKDRYSPSRQSFFLTLRLLIEGHFSGNILNSI